MGYEQDVADKQAMIEETARRRAQRDYDKHACACSRKDDGSMGAMSRPTQAEEDDRGWKMLMFLAELSWGVFVIDAEGNEHLKAAVIDQDAAMAFAVAIQADARQTRIRRLR